MITLEKTMDPEETLKAALRALAGEDYAGCLDYLIYYREWRDAGGFMPLNGDRRAKLIDHVRMLSVMS